MNTEDIRAGIDLEMLLSVEASLAMALEDYPFGPRIREYLEDIEAALRTAMYGPHSTPARRDAVRREIWKAAKQEQGS